MMARVADVTADYVVGVIGFRHQVAGIYTHLEGRKHSAVHCHVSDGNLHAKGCMQMICFFK